VWIDPIFEPLKAKTGRDFSVMLLTENELIGSLAEADLQAINLSKFFIPKLSQTLPKLKINYSRCFLSNPL